MIVSTKKFSKVLEETFSSKSYTSFLRQLSYYGFKKTKRNGNTHEYYNSKFLRSKKGSIHKITRNTERTSKIVKRKKSLERQLAEAREGIVVKEAEINRMKGLILEIEEANKDIASALQQFNDDIKIRVSVYCDAYMKLVFNYNSEIHRMMGEFFMKFRSGCRFGKLKKLTETEDLREAFDNLISDFHGISKKSFMHGSGGKDTISVFFHSMLKNKKLSMEQQFIMEKVRNFVNRYVFTTKTMGFDFDYLCGAKKDGEKQMQETVQHEGISARELSFSEINFNGRLFSDNESLISKRACPEHKGK